MYKQCNNFYILLIDNNKAIMKKLLFLLFLLPYLGLSQNYIPTKDVYDFDVGDEFHILYSGYGGGEYEKRRVVRKEILGLDTIKYVFNSQVKRYNSSSYNYYDYFKTIDSVTYFLSNDTIKDRILPCLDTFHPYYTPYWVGWGCEWTDSIYTNYSFYGKTYNIEYKPYYNFYNKRFFSKKLGRTYEEERSQDSGNPYFYYIRMDYYFKVISGETGGTPYSFTIGINELSNLDFKIYPNPAKDFISIDYLENYEYQLMNSLGQVLLSGKNEKSNIDISSIPVGIYFLKITNEVGNYGVKRVIVSR